jgi:hypothetical protein
MEEDTQLSYVGEHLKPLILKEIVVKVINPREWRGLSLISTKLLKILSFEMKHEAVFI